MSLLFTGGTTHRVDLASQAPSLGITRGTLLLWFYYPTAGASGALASLNDTVNSLLRANLTLTTSGTILRFLQDLVTTDLDVQASVANFAAWGTGKWLRIALQWATPNEAGGVAADQKLWVGDLSTGVAEPSSYSVRNAGAGNLSATHSTSHWKLGNRRQLDSNAPGNIAYAALFDRSAGTQMTAAEMDAWFAWPEPRDAVWMLELGADVAGGNPSDLTGRGHDGTITGATVGTPAPLNPFGLRREASQVSWRAIESTRERRARTRVMRRRLAMRESPVVLVQGGTPIIDGVLAIPVTYGLSGTGLVVSGAASIDGVLTIPITYGLSATGQVVTGAASIDGVLTVPITYGLSGTGTVVAGPAAIDGALTMPITYGLTGTGTVLSPTAPNGTTWTVPWRGGLRWTIPYQRQGMSSAFAKTVTRDNDFGILIGPITGRDPVDGVVRNYGGSAMTAFWAATADSDTPLGAVQGSFTTLGNARFLPSFDAPQQTLALAGLADRQDVFLILKGTNDFRAAIRFTFRLALEL